MDNTATGTEELLVQAILGGNPFERNRISDPSQMDCDVAAIHAAQFSRLTALAEEVCHGSSAKGVLLLGNAGTGKSHLLARLSRWASERQACFVFLHNIQVRPEDMGRYLLKCSINRLSEGRLNRLHDTQLYTVVSEAVYQAAALEGLTAVNAHTFAEVCGKLARRLGGDPVVFDLIFQLFFHVGKTRQSLDPAKRIAHARLAALAVRWLKGDVLDADEARQLGQRLRPHEEVLELREEQVESVLCAVARLARHTGRPFILCVDQADNMKEEQLSALCKSLHALVDAGQNLLVVVSGVREDILRLIEQGVIHAAAADRLDHKRPIVLHRIKRPEARLLISERLAALPFGAELTALADRVRGRADDLFPLGSEWFERIEPESLEFRPRDVLTWASDRWREVQGWLREHGWSGWPPEPRENIVPSDPPTPEEIQEAVDRRIAEKLAEAISARRLQPELLPADAGNLQGLTVALLQHCLQRGRGYSLNKLDAKSKGSADLVVCTAAGGATFHSHVMFVVTGSKQSAAAQLRRLLNSPGADSRILVTDEERVPLTLGAKGEEYLAELRELGATAFRHVPLTFEQYAQLDALMLVVGLARSHDLEIEPRPGLIMPVQEDQVIESYHRHDRYRQHPLLQLFLSGERQRKGGVVPAC